AVFVQRQSAGTDSAVRLVLEPVNDVWIGWRPRTRDVKREKPVFYAELFQLYTPAAGVIEGTHYASIRPAQGELNELVFSVPNGATVTDVSDPGSTAMPADNKSLPSLTAPLVTLWRFDPDTRKLHVTLQPAQSRPFALLIRSQLATGPLPVEQ